MKKAIWTVCVVFCAATLYAAQIPFEQAIADLKNPSADVRFRAVELLKDAAYPEAAIPLASVINDMDHDVQIEAVAAELNIFLAEKVTSRRHVGLIIEVRNKIAADASFSAGRSVLGAARVPAEVVAALRRAMHDESPRVSLEALYAFGTLAPEISGADRQDMLHASAPELAALLGAPDPAVRLAALRVTARVHARRSTDASADETLGDAIIGSLNERNADLRQAAMQALGAMRYARATQSLTDLFQYYKKGALAASAFDALARIASPASAPLFVAQLSSGSAAFKMIAVEGLARGGDSSKAPGIEKALAGDSSDALSLSSAFASASLSKGPIESIVEALSRPKLHDEAFGYLVELAPGRSKMFAQGSQDPDPRLRADVADILGLGGDPAAMPTVESMKQDRDPQVAKAAERAAARLRVAR